MDSLFSFFIKSDYVRAQILAFARHIVTSIGAGLVIHGYANDSMVQGAAGLVVASVSFYLAQSDVKGVDAKVKTALATPPDTSKVYTQPSPQGLTEAQEEKETALLNELQAIKPGK